MSDHEYYYCLDHRAVEPYDGCKSADRLGPYPTRAEAEQALAKLHARNEAWDAAEKAEREADDRDDDGSFAGPFPR